MLLNIINIQGDKIAPCQIPSVNEDLLRIGQVDTVYYNWWTQETEEKRDLKEMWIEDGIQIQKEMEIGNMEDEPAVLFMK